MFSLFSDKSSSTRVADLKHKIIYTLKNKNNWINLNILPTTEMTFEFEDNTLNDNIGYELRLLKHTK